MVAATPLNSLAFAQDVMISQRGSNMDEQMPFQLYTVSEKAEPITGSGGLNLVPDYTFDSAPQPKVIVVGAQRGSKALHAWLNKSLTLTDLIMSVRTGAFQLGRAGLLAGKSATTHHDFFAKSLRTPLLTWNIRAKAGWCKLVEDD